MNYVIMFSDGSLSHSGIPGMHWYIRRWQNKDGSLTPAGRERYLKSGTGELTKKGRKAAKKNPRILEESEAAKANYRKDAVAKGNLKFILKNKDDYSNQDIQTAIDRYNKEQQLATLVSDMSKSKIDKGIKYMKKASNILSTSTDLINKSTEFGQSLKKGADFLNSLDKTKKPAGMSKSDIDKVLKNPNNYSKNKIKETQEYMEAIDKLYKSNSGLYGPKGSKNQYENQLRNIANAKKASKGDLGYTNKNAADIKKLSERAAQIQLNEQGQGKKKNKKG